MEQPKAESGLNWLKLHTASLGLGMALGQIPLWIVAQHIPPGTWPESPQTFLWSTLPSLLATVVGMAAFVRGAILEAMPTTEEY